MNKILNNMYDGLKKVYDWLNHNELMLNINKTKWMMRITIKKCELNDSHTLKMGVNVIERVHTIKDLGIIPNDKWNMDDQIRNCIRKWRMVSDEKKTTT